MKKDTPSSLRVAAARVFAERGFEGASVREITRRARANLGAITYHFGSKAALFDAVLVDAVRGLRETLERADRPGPALDRMARLITAHVEYVAANVQSRRLVLQVLAADRALSPSVAAEIRRMPALFAGVIVQGQHEGSIRSGDPILLTIASVAQAFMLGMMRPLLRAGPGIDLDDPATRKAALQNALRFIRAGLSSTDPEG